MTSMTTDKLVRYRMYACKADGKWFQLCIGCETELTYWQVESKKRRLAEMKAGYLGGEFPIKKIKVIEDVTECLNFEERGSSIISEETL